jgi:hypothetical protein
MRGVGDAAHISPVGDGQEREQADHGVLGGVEPAHGVALAPGEVLGDPRRHLHPEPDGLEGKGADR